MEAVVDSLAFALLLGAHRFAVIELTARKPDPHEGGTPRAVRGTLAGDRRQYEVLCRLIRRVA
jgi:hypothetical protein